MMLLLGACAPEGTVQDRRRTKASIPGTYTYEVCVGSSKKSCAWTELTAKYGKVEYNRCTVGKKFPSCRSALD